MPCLRLLSLGVSEIGLGSKQSDRTSLLAVNTVEPESLYGERRQNKDRRRMAGCLKPLSNW